MPVEISTLALRPARGIQKRTSKKTRTSTKQSQLYNTFYTNNKFGCFAPYQSSSACLGNTKNSDSDMDSLPFGLAFWWDTLGGYWAPPTQSYLVLRRQKPAFHTFSSREEGIWLEEGDHMGYFMGKEMLNSPTIPVISNPLPLPPPKPRLTYPLY